ncbi:hypothetical protein C2845_PM11G26410 [Panicum miliaceum]|uniref:Uncharacterized protein n=1 Tax=Panicum miliaceum TaxID=4540 RepID=A0A3L6RSQ4_PANMI|nr:hypothetical protein C2845_PM11G26410 [Panicum miliaceum]
MAPAGDVSSRGRLLEPPEPSAPQQKDVTGSQSSPPAADASGKLPNHAHVLE